MPYIEQGKRDKLDPSVHILAGLVDNAGELNYVITQLVYQTIYGHKHYDAMNEALGVTRLA